ncbi:putative reverse transcriptase domain-containing protein [Tanacetum coccineum]
MKVGKNIPQWDFITKLHRTMNGHDAIWVVVDRLTKSAHFLAIREDYSTKKLARLYIDEIVAHHGVPVSIILDRDARIWCKETTDKVVVIKRRKAQSGREEDRVSKGAMMTKQAQNRWKFEIGRSMIDANKGVSLGRSWLSFKEEVVKLGHEVPELYTVSP